MKVIALSLVFSSMAFASEIQLTPGSSIIVKAQEETKVSCIGERPLSKPVCEIVLGDEGRYHVTMNGKTTDTFQMLKDAVATVDDLIKKNICL